ncbi:MAG: carboxypeptidase regulatory-like domain-containing protein, partial [Pseudomonadota bacterium]
MKSIKSRLVPVLLAGLLAGQVALADSESGDLAASLNRVALATNVEILYSPEVVAEKHAARTAVEGDPDVVLEHLLAGTGLAAQQTSPNVYVIREKTGTKTPLSVARLQAAPQTEQTTRSSQPQPSTIAAGIGALEGRVMDELSGTGLAGATVRLVGTNHQAVTDQRGYFRLGAVSSGSYELEIAYIGASPHIDRIDVSAGEDNVANFTLNPNDRDTIYVYANRSSFLQALNQQRNAENNKTVVSADLLGTFPAETVAEALRRVPGITFVRDAATGEANKVSVRGITSEGINVQLNGMQLQGTGIERAVDLTGFLADNISQITIQKSLLPEYEGTANGGLIEIETKSALDYGKRYFSVGVEREFGTESEFGDENQFNLSGVMQLSDTFAVGVSGQLRNSDRRNVGVTISDVLPPVLPEGFTSSFLLPFTFNFPYDAEFDDRLITNSNYLIRDREVENWTGSAFAAWDLGESTRLRAEVQHINNDTVTDLQRSTNQTLTGALTMPIPELGGAERRRSYIRALRPTNGASTIDETTKTDVFSIRGESFLNQWTLNYSAGLTKTSRETFSSTVNTLSDQNTDVLNLLDASSYTLNPDANGTDRIVDGAFGLVGDGIPQLALSQAGRDFYTSPDTYYVTSASNNVRFNETENLALKLNARYDLADSWLRNIKFGVQYNDIE